jgi:hypothetical protein
MFCNVCVCFCNTRWFKYDRDKLWLVYTQIVPAIFKPPCTYIYCVLFVYLYLLFCSYFVVLCFFVVIVVLCIFIFVCTSVGLLPPGETPTAVVVIIIIIIIKIIIIWHIRVACWTNKATRAPVHKHTDECYTYCFSTATMIRESTSMLRYTYIACLVTYHIHFLASIG